MKKIFILVCLVILSIFAASNFNIKAEGIQFDDTLVQAGGGSYQVTERTNYETIDYGVQYTRDVAVSQSLNQISGKKQFDPQVINLLEVPTSSVMKVVNWTYSTSNRWSLQTLTNLAEDFENNNPGWVVIAGINGDFFDINATKALPRQTTGAAVNNGEVVRAVSSGRQVGFTNDGTANSLIGGKNLQFTEYHTLSIYDENDDIITQFKVDKFNQNPTGEEISVYFSYYVLEGDKRNTVTNTVPATNSYIVSQPERGYATEPSKLYAKGIIDLLNQETALEIGQFAIVTENEELNSYLEAGVKVRIQQDVVGDYADCDNISGCGVQLVVDGGYNTATDGMSDYRHPRTVIGRKADGTIVLATVDGRQEAKDMYGMTYEELSAMMMYYGCEEAFNLDGGGSTTMIIRNGNGGFDVMNSPSDGGQRNDANAILVVVPEMKLYVNEVTDTTIDFSYLAKSKDISISNVEVTIKGQNYNVTKKIDSEEFLWEDLIPSTDYELVYSYDMEYNGNIIRNNSNPVKFSTGSNRPTVTDYYYEETDTHYVFSFNIDDPYNTITYARLKYDRTSAVVDKNSKVLFIPKSKVKEASFTLIITYNVGATPNSNSEDSYVIELKVEEQQPSNPPQPVPDEPKKSGCGSSSANVVIASINAAALLALAFRKRK